MSAPRGKDEVSGDPRHGKLASGDRGCVLVLAGLDPSGGAGLLADAEALRAFGLRPLCVATALTVQTTRHALQFQPVAPLLVQDSARALLEEEPIRAIKIGMVGAEQVARAILDLLQDFRALPLVVDPVLFASSGAPLFKGPGGVAAYLELMRGAIVTPNLAEAEALSGTREQEAAARALVSQGARAALVKGGHLDGDAIDLLYDGERVERLAGARIAVGRRGTGCRFASALAAGLASGRPLLEAAQGAKAFVRGYLLG